MLKAIRLYIDFTIDFETIGFLTGARLLFGHFFGLTGRSFARASCFWSVLPR